MGLGVDSSGGSGRLPWVIGSSLRWLVGVRTVGIVALMCALSQGVDVTFFGERGHSPSPAGEPSPLWSASHAPPKADFQLGARLGASSTSSTLRAIKGEGEIRTLVRLHQRLPLVQYWGEGGGKGGVRAVRLRVDSGRGAVVPTRGFGMGEAERGHTICLKWFEMGFILRACRLVGGRGRDMIWKT